MNREVMRLTVRSLYDIQKLRIEMGNRLSAQKRLGVLTEDWEKRLAVHQEVLEKREMEMGKDIKLLLSDEPIWKEFLQGVKGCGTRMAGVVISEISDPGKFDTVSKLWAYSGLHVKDGRAVRRKKGERANWNPFLKAKLVKVLGDCFIKSNSPYRKFYDDYKNRLLNRPCALTPGEHKKSLRGEDDDKAKEKLEPNGCTKGHMHNKAIRYMVKMFLLDLYVAWRTLNGLEVRPPYREEYLGRPQHAA